MITIQGEVPSQKNSKKVTYINGRPVVYTSASVKEWQQSAAWQLKKAPQYEGPVIITYKFYFRTNRRKDLDNAIASVNDALVKAEIIEDDRWQILTIGGASGRVDKEPRVELTIRQALLEVEEHSQEVD